MIITQPKKDYGTFNPMNWVGVIENAYDPLKIGMYKVRIIGLHSPDVEQVPVDILPWAHAVVPLSTGNTTSIAREGEWVVGYFLDPETLQYPVIVGILPGIQSTSVINITGSGSITGSSKHTNSAGFIPQLTAQQADGSPKLPEGIVTRSDGQPTTAPLARGVYENTSIQATDNSLEHVCDFKKKLRAEIAMAKAMTYKFVQEIRDQIKAFFAGLSGGLIPESVQLLVKQIRQVLKMIKKSIDFATDVAKQIAEFLKYCNEILAYIASLPARLAKFLQKCVKEFTDAILSIFEFSGEGLDIPSPFGEFKGLMQDARDVAKSAEKLVDAGTDIVKNAQSIGYTTKRFGKV